MAKATVVKLTGNAVVILPDGSVRALKVGDVIEKGQVIRTGAGAQLELLLDDGQIMAMGPAQAVRVDESIVATDATPTAADAAVQPQTIEQITQILQQGGDLTEQLDPAAAGAAGGGENDGASFVMLARIVEPVTPQSYAYQFDPQGPIDAPLLAAEEQVLPEASVVNVSVGVGVGVGSGGEQGDGTGTDLILTDPNVARVTAVDVPEGTGEGVKPVTFLILLDRPATAPVTVSYEIRPVSATPVDDYTPLQGTVVIPVGYLGFEVTHGLVMDALPEANESYQIVITQVEGATIGNPVATVTIIDDDVTVNPESKSGDESDGLQTLSGSLGVDFGPDDVGSIELSADNATWDSENRKLIDNDGRWEIVVHEDGTYTFTQKMPLSHSDTNDHDDVQTILVRVKATDSAGNVGQGEFTISINDDGPSAVIGTVSDATVTHDESAGVQNDDVAGPLAVFAGVTQKSADMTGFAVSAGPIVTAAGSSTGEDEEGATTEFSLSIANANPGLQTTDGDPITLSLENGLVVGRDAAGNAVFAIAIDPTTGVVSVAQWESIRHPTGGNSYDEAVNLGAAVNAVVTVTDGDGDVATSSVAIGSLIRFEDDGPTFISAMNGVVANTPNTEVTGLLAFNFGADQEGGKLSLLNNVAPTTLTSNGAQVNYFVDSSNPSLLTAYTGSDPNDPSSQVFKLQVNTNGTYTFTVLKAVDAPEVVPIGSSTSFGSGPTELQILQNTAGTQQLAILSGWKTNSGFTSADFTLWLNGNGLYPNDTVQRAVNGSTAGWGIGNNNFDGGSLSDREIFRIDFDDFDPFDTLTTNPGFDGPAVNFATIELTHFSNTDQLAYVVYYTDGTKGSASGTLLSLAGLDHVLTLGTAGKFIDYVEFMAISGSGKFDLVDVSTLTNTGTQNLSFNIDVIDGDGDVTSGVINITADGSTSVIDGAAGADAIAGNDLANALNGFGGNDILIGGAGDDTLAGGAGADVFKWSLGDQGTTASPARDVVMDFNPADGDKLDLRDLLQGENSGNLGQYLQFTTAGSGSATKLVLQVDHDGGGTFGETQRIVFDNYATRDALATSLGLSAGASDADILNKLKTDGKLITD